MGSKIPRAARHVLRDIVECANEHGMVLDGGMSKGYIRTFSGKGSLRVQAEQTGNEWTVVYKFWESNVRHELPINITAHNPVDVTNSVLTFLNAHQKTGTAKTELERYTTEAALSPHPKIRYMAAQSHLATVETLLMLAGDPVLAVRTAVIDNPHTPNNVRVLATSAQPG